MSQLELAKSLYNDIKPHIWSPGVGVWEISLDSQTERLCIKGVLSRDAFLNALADRAPIRLAEFDAILDYSEDSAVPLRYIWDPVEEFE